MPPNLSPGSLGADRFDGMDVLRQLDGRAKFAWIFRHPAAKTGECSLLDFVAGGALASGAVFIFERVAVPHDSLSLMLAFPCLYNDQVPILRAS